jgi:hypothetical protein
VEIHVLDALGELRLNGARAEMPFDGAAAVWVPIDSRRQLLVSAHPIDSDTGEFGAVGARHIRGIAVEIGEPAGVAGEFYRFDCGELRYYIAGSAPPPFVGLDAFLDAFIGVLNCAAP